MLMDLGCGHQTTFMPHVASYDSLMQEQETCLASIAGSIYELQVEESWMDNWQETTMDDDEEIKILQSSKRSK